MGQSKLKQEQLATEKQHVEFFDRLAKENLRLNDENRKKAEAHTKELTRQRVLSMQQEKVISNGRICKMLGLDPGNIGAWLKNGAGGRVSLETAGKVFDFMESAE